MNDLFRPRLFDHLKTYDRRQLGADLAAGVTVGVVALPLAMAFAIASGVKPDAGLITAIIAGFLISALGGSRVQIGGPAGAFVVIVYGIIERYGLANLLISTMLAGILMFAMGALRIGGVIRFIPVSIVIGFTNGIAVLIALAQLREFLGLQVDALPSDFFTKIYVIATHLHTIHVPTLALAVASLVIVVAWPKVTLRANAIPALAWLSRVPGSIPALVVGTLLVGLGVVDTETIGSRFGQLPSELPAPTLPSFTWLQAKQLLVPTITIALLGAIESLLCARVADNMIDDRHDPNQELMAQGIANLVTPLFGGIPATGTIARTVTNVRSGGRTPVAGMVHAVTLLVILLVAAPLAADVPLATLAAILLFVAWNMGEWHEFARLKHFLLPYRTVFLASFILTVVFDLTIAVEVGLVLACGFFIYRVSTLTKVDPVLTETTDAGVSIEAYHLFGSLFFGAIGKLETLLDPRRVMPDVMILDMQQLISIDTTGLDALINLERLLEKRGGQLILAGLNDQPRSLMDRGGLLTRVGDAHVVPDLPTALKVALDWRPTPGQVKVF